MSGAEPDWVEVAAGPGIAVRRRGGALHIELARPEVHNAFDFDMTRALSEVVVAAADDPSVRAVLISGRGPSFSSGADLRTAFDPEARGQVGQHLRRWTTPMILALRSMPKPVVAAVRGNAVGAGCSLAVACDYVVAGESASLHLAFSRVGLTMDGGAGATVAARAGFSVASSMALLGEPLDAARALAVGLVEKVVPDDELDGHATGLLLQLASGPTESYAATKEILGRYQFAGLAEILDLEADRQERLLASRDFAEALDALTSRRVPRFHGADRRNDHDY